MSRLLILAAAVACTAASTPVPRAAPTPVVVLVHGRGQFGQDSAALRRDWKRDIDGSLRRAGLDTLRDEAVRLAWYADVLDPESESGCMVARDTAALGFGAFTRGLLASITSALPQEESRGARGVIGDLLYIVDPWKRCAAERSVAKVVESAAADHRPVIVVAYSLGSMVSYDYLSSATSLGEVHLVTLGSPLGVSELQELLLPDVGRVRRPAGVASWVNVYDADDVFAAPLGRDATSGILDRRVESSAPDNAHDARHYLRDPATAAALARAICAATHDSRPPGCGAR